MKRVFILLLVSILNAAAFAQSVDDAVYCTEVTYEIMSYKGNSYTPLMYLCQDAKTKEYYHLSNYENYSDSCLVFYMGTLENTKVLYKKINEYIISGDSTLNTTITDAKNRKFKLLAPQEEKRIGTFVIIQEDGSDKWGIISKNHISNFSRVFPED
jgi:hypothetical protein